MTKGRSRRLQQTGALRGGAEGGALGEVGGVSFNMAAAAVRDLSRALISVSSLAAGDSKRVKVGCKQLREEPEVQPRPIREEDLRRVIYRDYFFFHIPVKRLDTPYESNVRFS